MSLSQDVRRWCAPALLLILIGWTTAADTAGAKGRGSVEITKPVNELIPDPPAGPDVPDGVLTSTIEVGKKFRGRRIRDVSVTMQTTGASGMTPATDLSAKLSAPNGATSLLFAGLSGSGPTNLSIGPVTLDDESPFFLGIPSFQGPNFLQQPWAGSAVPGVANGSGIKLAVMDGGPVKGNWTLSVFDRLSGEQSVLAFWRLNVVTGKPYETK